MMNLILRKKKCKNLSLYRKEQLVICALLLCFGLTVIMLPQIKKQTALDKNNVTEVISSDDDKSDADTANSNETTSNEQAVDESTANEATVSESTVTEPADDKSNDGKLSNTVPKDDSAATDSNTSSADSQSPADSSQKVWVPPVYKTVHHEAVYETKRIVVCNYCNETFDTVGEFQIHKNANGG